MAEALELSREGPTELTAWVRLPPMCCVWLGAPTPDWRLKTGQLRKNKPFCNYMPPEESACPHRLALEEKAQPSRPADSLQPQLHLSNGPGCPPGPRGNSSPRLPWRVLLRGKITVSLIVLRLKLRKLLRDLILSKRRFRKGLLAGRLSWPFSKHGVRPGSPEGTVQGWDGLRNKKKPSDTHAA